MRLIDSDELIKDRVSNDSVVIAAKCAPTAYDVDKVISKIKDAIIETPLYRHKFCGTVKPEHCVKYEWCEDCMAERMIEIIKSGGIEP